MKVGYITSEYPHPKIKNAAGIGTSIKNLAVALVKNGIQVIVFVYHQKTNEVVVDEGVEIHLIKNKHYKLFGWYLYRKHINKYVNNIVTSQKINLLEAPDWTGITAFMKFSVPLVIRFHGSDAYFCKLEKRKQKAKNFWFEKNAVRNASAYIAPTTFAGEISKKIFDLDASKIKTIHYGLEIQKFNNENIDQYKENTILYIGTIIRKKGVFELAQIFNKIIEVNPEAQLIMIGNDSSDQKSGNTSTFSLVNEVLSESAKKSTNYLGKVPYKEVQSYIKNAHVCVFPSFAETLGMVTIESMALNKPVVNTNIGWAQELIDDGENGFLVHPSDIDLYTKNILKLLNDKDKCRRIGEAARLKVEDKFDINKNVMINIEYYKSILNNDSFSS